MAEKNDQARRSVNIYATMTLLDICKNQTESIRHTNLLLVFASQAFGLGIMPDLVTMYLR